MKLGRRARKRRALQRAADSTSRRSRAAYAQALMLRIHEIQRLVYYMVTCVACLKLKAFCAEHADKSVTCTCPCGCGASGASIGRARFEDDPLCEYCHQELLSAATHLDAAIGKPS